MLIIKPDTTTTKSYPTKWGQLHGSNNVIMFHHNANHYHHIDSKKLESMKHTQEPR